jgi:hypothetical protein
MHYTDGECFWYLFLDEVTTNFTNITCYFIIMPFLQMSCSVWFKQEANINPSEDFLVSRHEYLLNRLTSSAVFDSSDISQLASEILLTLYTMDCTQDSNVSSVVPSLGSILESRRGK